MTGSHLEKQVDELVDTFNDIAKMLGKETIQVKTEDETKPAKFDLKKV